MSAMPKPKRIARRRAIGIFAAVAGLPLLARADAASRSASRPIVHRWSGTALGARASIILHHPDAEQARALIAEAAAEIERLERIFSLYRRDSALSTLNRSGRLDAPPLDLIHLLSEARGYSEVTGGAFDVTVQPLWDLYATHFRRPGADPDGPPDRAVEQARALVDYRHLDIESAAVTLARPGAAVTCNGIAQGYITDRVAALFRDAGLEHVLLDLGEVRALGPRDDGRGWRVGIRDPLSGSRLLEAVDLTGGAIASSAGSGTTFEPSGRCHHLFDPRTGRSANRYAGVTVMAPSATAADALSTGLACMSNDALLRARPALAGIAAHFVALTGAVSRWTA
jgi:thiamine biosynthesis lipoprotein